MKILASVGMIAASLFSSVGIAAASGYVYVNPYGQTYKAGGSSYRYNNGTTSGAGHVFGATGPYNGGYTAGTTSCVNGVSCTHYGQGATRNGGFYNNNVNSVNNGNGTSTVYWNANYRAPGGTTQNRNGSATVYHRY